MTDVNASPDVAQGRMQLDELLSVEEVARYLGVPPGTLANWRYQGRGPAFVRIGRLIRYRAEDVTRWIESSVTYSPDAPPDNTGWRRPRTGSR